MINGSIDASFLAFSCIGASWTAAYANSSAYAVDCHLCVVFKTSATTRSLSDIPRLTDLMSFSYEETTDSLACESENLYPLDCCFAIFRKSLDT